MDIEQLKEIFREGVTPTQVEPHIYSILDGEVSASYDRWGGFYEKVACNRFYNRLIWGYRISEYHRLCLDALKSGEGWVLDAGCGSLAFSAGAYLSYTGRHVILSDQSIKMLRLAKHRLIRLNGRVPENMIFLHADAMHLPFRDRSIETVISMNLIHAVQDAKRLLKELARVMAPGGSGALTTLIMNNRYADFLLHKLAEGGALTERNPEELRSVFAELGINGSYCAQGNLAFINLGKPLPYFVANNCQPLGQS